MHFHCEHTGRNALWHPMGRVDEFWCITAKLLKMYHEIREFHRAQSSRSCIAVSLPNAILSRLSHRGRSMMPIVKALVGLQQSTQNAKTFVAPAIWIIRKHERRLPLSSIRTKTSTLERQVFWGFLFRKARFTNTSGVHNFQGDWFFVVLPHFP